MDKIRFSIVGSGNVAWHLTRIFKAKKMNHTGIWSRNSFESQKIADEFDVKNASSTEELFNISDVIILSVSDSAISEVSSKLSKFEGIVAHTSGSVDITELNSKIKRKAVFYPLQTFTKGKVVDFENIPFFIEATNKSDEELLMMSARKISNKVYFGNSKTRLTLHVAAVFASNYANYLYLIAERLLNEKNIDFDVLHQLILEVAEKATLKSPKAAQTGPAKRGDISTINKHISYLENFPKEREIYELLAKRIFEEFQ